MMGKSKKILRPKGDRLKPENALYYPRFVAHPYPFLLLAAAALLLYSHTLLFELGNLDEENLISNHAALFSKSSNLPTVLSSDPFFSTKGYDFYRPLQNLSYFLDTQFFGPKPFGYRISNLVFHWLTCCALFSLLTLLSLDRFFSFVAAMLYCIHPLFSSVAWMPARGDLMIAFLISVSVLWLLRFLDSGNHRFLALHLVAFAIAIGTKETALILPVLVLYILFVLRRQRGLPGFYLYLFPAYALIAAVYLYLRERVLMGGRSDNLFGIQPLLSNLAVLPESVAKFVLPWHFSLMSSFSPAVTIIGCLIIAVLLALFVRAILRKQATVAMGGFGICWFLVFSLPGMMFQFRLVGASYDYLEHRTYLPLIGLVILLLSLLPRHWDAPKVQSSTIWIGGICCLLAFIAYRTSMAYENPARFYAAAIESNPRNSLAYHNGARVKTQAGDHQGAIADLGTAIGLSPNYASAYCLRGATLGMISRYQEALTDLNRCLELKSDYVDGYFNRALTSAALKDFRGAAADMDAAIRLHPEDPKLYGLRGSVRKEFSDQQGACADWRSAAALGDSIARSLLQANCR